MQYTFETDCTDCEKKYTYTRTKEHCLNARTVCPHCGAVNIRNSDWDLKIIDLTA